jgi:hypothetical protein
MCTIPPGTSVEAVSEKLTFAPWLTLNLARSVGVGYVQFTVVESLLAAGTSSRSARATAERAAGNNLER